MMYHYVAKTPYGEFRREVPNAEYKFCIVYLIKDSNGVLAPANFRYSSWTSRKSYIKRVATEDGVINYGADAYEVFPCELTNQTIAEEKIYYDTQDPLEQIIGDSVF